MGASMIDQGIAPPPGAPLIGNVAYIPPGLEGLYMQPFSYNIVFASIGAASGALTGQANVQNDSWFICVAQYADIWDAADGVSNQIQPINFAAVVRLLDTSAGSYMMDQPTPFSSYFGTAEQPFVWLYRSRIYMPGGQIQAELTVRSATLKRVQLTFTGFKVWDQPDQRISSRTNG